MNGSKTILEGEKKKKQKRKSTRTEPSCDDDDPKTQFRTFRGEERVGSEKEQREGGPSEQEDKEGRKRGEEGRCNGPTPLNLFFPSGSSHPFLPNSKAKYALIEPNGLPGSSAASTSLA